MAPNKKKDKSKSFEWLQCSMSGKLISSEDAAAHSTSGSVDLGYIQDKALHGKVINAESLLGEDGISVTKSIRDQDTVVWLAIQTMQVCGLAIGQLCVLNKVLVKRAWPHKSLPLSGVALSQVSREELNVSKEEFVTVERFHQLEEFVVESAKLMLREDNPMFESDEFAAFVAGYLDGKFVSEGSPLLIRYFGQTCHCSVASLKYRLSTPQENAPESTSVILSAPNTPSTPLKNKKAKEDSSIYSTPVSVISSPSEQPTSISQDLSDSLASMNISDTAQSPSLTSTPLQEVRQKYPNLVTPIKGEGDAITMGTLPIFARVSSVETAFSVKGPSAEESADKRNNGLVKNQVSLEDVGGLSAQIEELRIRIARALNASSTSRCLLLYGPAGTGKSLLVKALTRDLGLTTLMVTGTDIWSKLFGEAESNLRRIFKTAQDRAPSVIVIDDIDVICPRISQNSSGQQAHRIVGTLLSLIDNISSKKHASSPVVVLGVTNNREGMDPTLRRAGRFGYEVEIGVPTAPQRSEILKSLLRHVRHTLKSSDIMTVAGNAHGYVGADLAALVNEASMHAMMSKKSQEGSDQPMVTLDNLVYAGLHVKPSALREIQLEVPQVHWSDIGGMSEVKTRLREAVELPLSHPEVFKNLGIEPPRGLLMYGPPGCSKTMVARALATECKLNFLAVKGPELFNQYVGESEKAIREVFRKARSAAPSVIFFDEIDAIAAKRGSSSGGSGVDDRVLTQLLTEMDGLEFLKDVFIMAATNRPDKIDNALLRPGRFDSLVYVPLPDSSTRQEILLKKFERMRVAESVSLEKLVDVTEDYSGAEVVQVCQEAALHALRESLEATTVQQHHFDAALKKVVPQINPELLQVYNKFLQAAIK